MIRRFLSLFFLLLVVHSCCGIGPAIAQSVVTDRLSSDLTEPAAAPAEMPQPIFQSGVKYDPISHRWLDRYSGKPMDLGLPGVADRYGAQNVIADNDVVAANGGTSTGSTTTSTTSFNYKQWLIITLLGLGIATSIAVPIAVGVYTHHHHHHIQNNWQENQLAAFYFFHNKTISIPHIFVPPPPFEHHAPPPPPPQPN